MLKILSKAEGEVTPESPTPKKVSVFGVIEFGLGGAVLGILAFLLLLLTLNYFNILSLSKINPKLFGSLPHKPYTISTTKQTPLQSITPTPTIFPYDSKKATSLLTQYLKDTLKPAFLPSTIDIKQGLSIDNRSENLQFEFGSYFSVQGATISANFHYKENSNTQNDFAIFVQPANITPTTATESLANSLLSAYFKNPYSISNCQSKGTTSYCENFQTITDGKRGYGIVILNQENKPMLAIFSCFVPKESQYYSTQKTCIRI